MKLLNNVTATGAGPWVGNQRNQSVGFDASVVGTGAVSASITIEVSNDGVNALPGGSVISLAGTTNAYDGFVGNLAYAYVRANVTAISGTGATVNCTANMNSLVGAGSL